LQELSSNFLEEILKSNAPPKYLKIGSKYSQPYEPMEGQGIYQLIPYYQRIKPKDSTNNHDPRYIIQKHPLNGQYLLTKVVGWNREFLPFLEKDYDILNKMSHATIASLLSENINIDQEKNDVVQTFETLEKKLQKFKIPYKNLKHAIKKTFQEKLYLHETRKRKIIEQLKSNMRKKENDLEEILFERENEIKNLTISLKNSQDQINDLQFYLKQESLKIEELIKNSETKLEEKEDINIIIKFELEKIRQQKETLEQEISGIKYQNQILLEKKTQNENEKKNNDMKHKILKKENLELQSANKNLLSQLRQVDFINEQYSNILNKNIARENELKLHYRVEREANEKCVEKAREHTEQMVHLQALNDRYVTKIKDLESKFEKNPLQKLFSNHQIPPNQEEEGEIKKLQVELKKSHQEIEKLNCEIVLEKVKNENLHRKIEFVEKEGKEFLKIANEEFHCTAKNKQHILKNIMKKHEIHARLSRQEQEIENQNRKIEKAQDKFITLVQKIAELESEKEEFIEHSKIISETHKKEMENILRKTVI
jgi:hypothetical protein